MVKSELIGRITEKLNVIPLKEVELSINQIIECLSNELCQGGRIEIRGFGSFCLHYRPPRNAHNPKTGERVATLPKHTPHFKPGKELRHRVNSNAEQFVINNDAQADEDE